MTGHKDIPEQDTAIIGNSLRQEIQATQKKYPNSTINILSGLAEGAVQLMVEDALDSKIDVDAIFPFERSEYEKDFRTAASIHNFRHLLGQCSDVKVCKSSSDATPNRGYSESGKPLVGC